jgi:O-antigen/teichoic acid export membrane protein
MIESPEAPRAELGSLSLLGKRALVYGLGNVANRLLALLLLPVFTAYLPPADYGVVALLTLVATLLAPVVSLGVGYGILPLYYDKRECDHAGRVVWTAFTISFAGAALLTVPMIVAAPWISWSLFGTVHYQDLVCLALLTSAVSSLSSPHMLALQFQERAAPYVAFTAITSLAYLGTSVVLVVVYACGPWGVLVAQLLSQAIGLALFATATVLRLRYRFDREVAVHLLKLSVPMIPSGIFVFFLLHGNRYLLQWLEGLDAVGIYSVGLNLGLAIGIAIQAFSAAWNPFFMSFLHKQEEARPLFRNLISYYVYGFGAMTLLFFAWAKPVVMLLTQASYHEAYKVVGMAAGSQFLTGLYYAMLPPFYYVKDIHFVGIAQGLALLISILLSLLLIPSLSLCGAGLSLVAGHLAMVLIVHAKIRLGRARYLQIEYEWRRIACFGAIALPVAAASLIERQWTLAVEAAFSCSIVLMTLVTIFCLFKRSERQAFMALAGNCVHRFRLR